MNIFNIFKTQEEIYYKKFKKLIIKSRDKKITVSNLKVRVMTIEYTVEDLIKKRNELESTYHDLVKKLDTSRLKNILKEQEDLKLKLTVLFKIQHECENDFIRAVKLKFKDLVDDETLKCYSNYEKFQQLINTHTPSNYKQWVLLSDRVSSLFSTVGRYVTSEEIKNF
jgi:hypothetical protein